MTGAIVEGDVVIQLSALIASRSAGCITGPNGGAAWFNSAAVANANIGGIPEEGIASRRINSQWAEIGIGIGRNLTTACNCGCHWNDGRYTCSRAANFGGDAGGSVEVEADRRSAVRWAKDGSCRKFGQIELPARCPRP